MEITAKQVMALRDKTGVGMMDCKKALVEANGDFDKAVELLREKGMATAVKRAGKIASEGIVDTYIHMGGKIGVMVEINCETDFVAKSDKFHELAHDIALQIMFFVGFECEGDQFFCAFAYLGEDCFAGFGAGSSGYISSKSRVRKSLSSTLSTRSIGFAPS